MDNQAPNATAQAAPVAQANPGSPALVDQRKLKLEKVDHPHKDPVPHCDRPERLFAQPP
jgi:hypothetical protein